MADKDAAGESPDDAPMPGDGDGANGRGGADAPNGTVDVVAADGPDAARPSAAGAPARGQSNGAGGGPSSGSLSGSFNGPSVGSLDFERPIVELEAQIAELRNVGSDANVNISEEIERLKSKSDELTRSIFGKLTAWQVAQLARHPQRPYTLDYAQYLFTDFEELHGDRAFADDPAVVGGLARLDGQAVVVIGHQKGRSTRQKLERRFGMPGPEGYRKALRLMKLAERFSLPVLTFIDTPGAYPGVGAEERGQSEAIARNLLEMARLRTPVVVTVIGEGGSGGALALGVGDRVLMLQHSIYSVISPEGCASILWKSAEKAADAAEAMGITSARLLELELVDRIVAEPLGGAHRDPERMAADLKQALLLALGELTVLDHEALLEARYERLMRYGHYKT